MNQDFGPCSQVWIFLSYHPESTEICELGFPSLYPSVYLGQGAIKLLEINRFEALYPVQRLNDHQKVILKTLGRHKNMNSGELYREYARLSSKPVLTGHIRST